VTKVHWYHDTFGQQLQLHNAILVAVSTYSGSKFFRKTIVTLFVLSETILFHYELILFRSDLQHILLNWPGSQAYFSVHLNHHLLAVLV
jgi:hypothetical protein